MKKKVIIIAALGALAAAAAAAIFFLGGKTDVTRGVTGEYAYCVTENRNGTLELAFEKNDLTAGVWRFEAGEEDTGITCSLKKGKKDRFCITPKECGTTEADFILQNGERDVYCYGFLITVDEDMKIAAVAMSAFGIAEDFSVEEGSVRMDCSSEGGSTLVTVTCDAGDIWNIEFPEGLEGMARKYSGATRTFCIDGTKAGDYEVLLHNLTADYSLSVSVKVEDTLACIPQSGEIVKE